MLIAIATLRPVVRRRAAVLLLPAFVTTTLACWGFRSLLPDGPPVGLLMLSPQSGKFWCWYQSSA